MKKIYITGICGLLGSNIVNRLKDKYEIRGADLIPFKLKGAEVECFDLLDHEKLRESIFNFGPDVIIHTAAYVNVDACEVNIDTAMLLNGELTKRVVQIATEIESKVVYISTDAVFSGEKEGLYVETDQTSPINVYGRSKLLGERYVSSVNNNLILRTNIYGINVQNKKSLGEWIVDSLRDNLTLNMFTDIRFSPILVSELAEVIDDCIEKNATGIYHACGTGEITKYDFGCLIKKIFAIENGTIIACTSEMMNFKAPRSKNMGMSNYKITETLGISISTVEESIIRFKKEMEKYEDWKQNDIK